MSDIEEDFDLSAIYGHDDDEAETTDTAPSAAKEDLSFSVDRDTVLIRDAKGNEVRVPSMAYVRKQNETIEAQARTIRFLTSRERMMRQAINAHSQDIKDLWKETERKWD